MLTHCVNLFTHTLMHSYCIISIAGDTKFAGPENDGPRKNKDWRLQY